MSTTAGRRDGLSLRLLGPLAADLDGRLLDLGGRLRRALLADLALHANEVLSTDRLIDDLWGDAPPANPLNALQVYVGQLRRILEPGRAAREAARVLSSTPPGYELVIDEVGLDALAFETLVAEGHAALLRGDPSRGAGTLREGLALWRGDALPEFAGTPFAQAGVARLADMRLTALEARIEAEITIADPRLVTAELAELTGSHPYRERLWELRMLALHLVGRSAEALRAYQTARQVLGDHLGIEPGASLQRLDQRIAQQDPTLHASRSPAVRVTTRPDLPVSERLVGRSVELGRLEELLATAIAGTGTVAVVTGEAGFGKTRLVTELATRAWTRGSVVASGRCFESAAGAPFAPIVESLSSLARAVDPDLLRTGAGRAAGVVARLVPDLRDLLGALPEPPTLPPEEDRARLFDGVARFVLAATRIAPTVLVLDDLQWSDLPTLALAGYLARAASPARLLIVACYRPDEIDPVAALGRSLAAFEREGAAAQVVLGPLTDLEAAELAGDLLGDPNHTAIDEIVHRAGGHPFFLQELARGARSGDLLSPDVPTGARDLVLQRLRRLPAPCQRLALAASVFDGPFEPLTAAAAAGLSEEEGLDALDALMLAAMVIPAGENDRFEFVHDIARQATYASLSAPRRVRLHRAVANVIEDRWAASAQVRVAAALARHYARSASIAGADRGAIHAERAATAAEGAHAYDEAVTMLALALDLLPAEHPSAPQVMGRLGQALLASGEESAGLSTLLAAASRIADVDGPQAAAEVLAEATSYALERGAWNAGPDLAAAGLEYVDAAHPATSVFLKLAQVVTTGMSDPDWPGMILGTPEQLQLGAELRSLPVTLRPRALSTILLAYHSRKDVLEVTPDEPAALAMWAGEFTLALEMAGPMAAEDEDAGRIESAIVHRCTEARCLNALGRFDESDVAFGHGVNLLQRLVAPSMFAGHLLSVEEERWAALGDAWGRLRVDLRGSIDSRSAHWYAVARRVSEARVLAHTGAALRAIEHLVPALDAIEAAPAWSENYVRILYSAAEVHWLAGRDDYAAVIERNAREKVLEPDFRYPMTDLRLAVARLVTVQGRFDEAAEWFDQARSVLDEQQSLPLRTIVDHDQGIVEERMGHTEASRALLLVARRQATALGMSGWVRSATAQLSLAK